MATEVNGARGIGSSRWKTPAAALFLGAMLMAALAVFVAKPAAAAPASFIPSGITPPAPVIYQFFDWGTDFQATHPEYGPVGAAKFVTWEMINPGPGAFNWQRIEDYLNQEAGHYVTMRDGTVIPKPVVMHINLYLVDHPNRSSEAAFYDSTPQWVYQQMGGRPSVGGRLVGHVLTCGSAKAVMPAYDDPAWRDAVAKMIAALGARYNNDPRIAAFFISTGIDDETILTKDASDCKWTQIADQQVSGISYRFNQFILETMRNYRTAFPTKALYINNAPGDRKTTSDYAASLTPPVGIKNCGLDVDIDSWDGYGGFVGLFTEWEVYSNTIPIWLETRYGLGSAETRYWTFMAGLHYHPDGMDVHPEFLTQSQPEWLAFVADHLGKTIKNTPDVYTILRDAEFPKVLWSPTSDLGNGGHAGDWDYWLYRMENAPGNKTVRIWRTDIPAAAQTEVYSRQARRTDQATGNPYMSFNVDDGYPYAGQKPLVSGGRAAFRVTVMVLNHGTDTFSLEYMNYAGQTVRKTIQKGASLGAVDHWVEVTFLLTDAYLNNNMPGGADLRLNSNGDGDEVVHRVRVAGGWDSVPAAPAPPPGGGGSSSTVTPTATRAPGTVVPTPTSIYGTPTRTATTTATPSRTLTPSRTATGTLTATGTRTATATRTPAATQTSTATATPIVVGPNGTDVVVRRESAGDAAVDTYLNEWAPTGSRGNDQDIVVRNGNVMSSLLRFTVPTPPAGSSVQKAVLRIYALSRSNANPLTIAAGTVIRPWSESQANWTLAQQGVSWGAPGAADTATDRSSVTLSTATANALNTWVEFDVTAAVRDWYKSPADNAGLILRGISPVSVEYHFASSQRTDVSLRPQLRLTFGTGTLPTLPPPTSTPQGPTPTKTATTVPGTPRPTATATPTGQPTSTPAPTQTAAPLRQVLQQGVNGYAGQTDTYINQWSMASNYGQTGVLYVRQGDVKAGLIRFDLGSVQPRGQLASARLRLYINSASNTNSMQLQGYALNRAWNPLQASWVQAAVGTLWAQAGANGTADRSSTPAFSYTLKNKNTWIEVDVTTAVQNWLQSPESNYGLALKGSGTVSVEYGLTAAEWWDAQYRPQLVLNWQG